ncbi:MAG: hypothetical protein AVDCRST_MAG60-2366, partial [uncultured Nocardioides sp.]
WRRRAPSVMCWLPTSKRAGTTTSKRSCAKSSCLLRFKRGRTWWVCGSSCVPPPINPRDAHAPGSCSSRGLRRWTTGTSSLFSMRRTASRRHVNICSTSRTWWRANRLPTRSTASPHC